MGKFYGSYTLRPIGPDLFECLPDPVTGFYWISNSGNRIDIESMHTDGATIPRWFRWIKWMSPTSVTDAAVLHDSLYEQEHRGQHPCTFHEANEYLFEAIGDLPYHVPLIKRAMYLIATELFGRFWWNEKIFGWENVFMSEEK
jgi:hypothetical protein